VRSSQHSVLGLVNCLALCLCRLAPKQKDEALVPSIELSDDCIGECLPPLTLCTQVCRSGFWIDILKVSRP
jgi:hypothetical protein